MAADQVRVLQQDTTRIWDDVYSTYEAGAPVGIQYPSEPLVIFVSNQRKSSSLAQYFEDSGSEYSIKTRFSGAALELGFGSLANLRMVREKGYRCFGLEVSAEAIARARRELARLELDGIEVSAWTPYQFPYETDSFDLVYGLGCIYYNLDIETVVKEVFRVLRKDGRFLFSFFSAKHSYMQWCRRVTGHIYQWTDHHPNPRLRGAYLIRPGSVNALLRMFSDFNDVRVFRVESDQTPVFESWWYVCGRK